MTAYWPRIPSKPSTARWRRGRQTRLRPAVLPIPRRPRVCGTPSSCFRQLAEGFRAADPAPIILRLCRAAIRTRSRRAPITYQLRRLRPARPDRTPAQQLPLSRHRIRLPGSPVLHAPSTTVSFARGLGRRTSTPPRRRRPRSSAHSTNSTYRSKHGSIRPNSLLENLDTFSPCVLTQAGLEAG